VESTQGYRLNDIVANYRQRVELPSFSLAVDWFDRAFRSLAAMHASGRVHRSIGADKVLIGGDDEVTIDDGLASADPSNSPAPEQLAGRAVDQRTDVYCLGAAFYEFLTLRRPGSYPDAPSSVNVTVPKGFDAIILRTLATQPEDRYPNAEEVLADLAAFRRSPASRIMSGRMAPGNQPVRPAGVPRPAMIAAGAILGALCGTIAGWLVNSIFPISILVGAVVGGIVGSLSNSKV
jgi:serine/threonine protein kinase